METDTLLALLTRYSFFKLMHEKHPKHGRCYRCEVRIDTGGSHRTKFTALGRTPQIAMHNVYGKIVKHDAVKTNGARLKIAGGGIVDQIRASVASGPVGPAMPGPIGLIAIEQMRRDRREEGG